MGGLNKFITNEPQVDIVDEDRITIWHCICCNIPVKARYAREMTQT
jgi:hypothetical protein